MCSKSPEEERGSVCGSAFVFLRLSIVQLW